MATQSDHFPHPPEEGGGAREPPAAAAPAAPPALRQDAATVSGLHLGSDLPSAARQRFQRLLQRTETLAQQIVATQAIGDAWRPQFAKTVLSLETQRDGLLRGLVLLLDQRLAQPGLTRSQQRQARDILCGLAGALARMGDEAMRALHDLHSAQSLAEQQRDEAQQTQALVEDLLGGKLEGEVDYADPDAVLAASLAQWQAQEDAREAARAAHQARRKKPGARKSKAAQEAQDADGALRALYRQLASALHPDRESDPVQRERKTALMSEANAAYARRDLMALMQLQLREALTDSHRMSAMAREKIAALTTLLKERSEVLAGELASLEQRLRGEFGLPAQLPVTEAHLRRQGALHRHHLQDEIDHLQYELRALRDDAELKRWLREQHKLARAYD